MSVQALRWAISRNPWKLLAGWAIAAAAVTLIAPDLTRLAAEGQARLVPEDAESARAKALIREFWPEQWYQSMAVLAVHRAGGLTAADEQHVRAIAERLEQADRPRTILRVLGPDADPAIAERLRSKDDTLELVLVPLNTSFVAPITQETVSWLAQATLGLAAPAGLELRWTGDAVIGRDYMREVQVSLDRAAIVTVFLLLGVLLFVYRSFLLAAVPLATIGVGLLISRGVLAWMAVGGWEISPLVELFLVVILFGCGTDFCLFLSWRYAEHWNGTNAASAMRQTLRSSFEPIITSAGTVIVGLSLMGTTRFKLFSSTGPSVAIGLAITLIACMTLAPALLVLLARFRPRALHWLARERVSVWDGVGALVLRKPAVSWLATLGLMIPLAVVGARTHFVQDLLSEMPRRTPAVESFRLIARKFGPGTVAPLSLVVKADTDLHSSEGLALLDDLSRLLTRQRQLAEVRSATQPLGSPRTLAPARLAARLGAVNEGFTRMAEGADELSANLIEGSAKIKTALQLKEATGIDLIAPPDQAGLSLIKGLSQASSAMLGRPAPRGAAAPAIAGPPPPTSSAHERDAKPDPREQMAVDLTRAAEGARQIAEGARRAQSEVNAILSDPVGRRALDRLLINQQTVADHPEIRSAFQAYLSPDGRYARIDLVQKERFFSTEAMRQVGTLRALAHNFLMNQDEVPIQGVAITGANAESADIWAVTQRDQVQTWIVVPLGVFLLLLLALRNPLTCLNLVGTMVLTYLFALGVTHLVFVTWLGAEGLDWKVPLFLFVLLVAVGVDYNIFLMSRLNHEVRAHGVRLGIQRAIGLTGGLITSAAAITACSFSSFMSSPLSSIQQLGFALVIGIIVDAVLVRPVLVPCGHYLVNRHAKAHTTHPSSPRKSAPHQALYVPS